MALTQLTDLAALPEIPQPVAPARPASSTALTWAVDPVSGYPIFPSDSIYSVDQSGNPLVITSGGIYDGNTGHPVPLTQSTLQQWSQNHPYGYTPQSAGDVLNKTKQAANAVLHPIDTLTQLIFGSRLVYLLIGLILIGAGVYSFRVTQTVIETGTKAVKTAKKAAALMP